MIWSWTKNSEKSHLDSIDDDDDDDDGDGGDDNHDNDDNDNDDISDMFGEYVDWFDSFDSSGGLLSFPSSIFKQPYTAKDTLLLEFLIILFVSMVLLSWKTWFICEP